MKKKERETLLEEIRTLKETVKMQASLEVMVESIIRKALTRTITLRKGPRKQGDPKEQTVTEEVHILDFLCHYLPLVEASMRGMQEDLDRAKNDISANNLKLDTIGQTLIGMEGSAKLLATFSDEIKAIQPSAFSLLPGVAK